MLLIEVSVVSMVSTSETTPSNVVFSNDVFVDSAWESVFNVATSSSKASISASKSADVS